MPRWTVSGNAVVAVDCGSRRRADPRRELSLPGTFASECQRVENIGPNGAAGSSAAATSGFKAWAEVIAHDYEGLVAKEDEPVRGWADAAVLEGEAARLVRPGGPLAAADQRCRARRSMHGGLFSVPS